MNLDFKLIDLKYFDFKYKDFKPWNLEWICQIQIFDLLKLSKWDILILITQIQIYMIKLCHPNIPLVFDRICGPKSYIDWWLNLIRDESGEE